MSMSRIWLLQSPSPSYSLNIECSFKNTSVKVRIRLDIQPFVNEFVATKQSGEVAWGNRRRSCGETRSDSFKNWRRKICEHWAWGLLIRKSAVFKARQNMAGQPNAQGDVSRIRRRSRALIEIHKTKNRRANRTGRAD